MFIQIRQQDVTSNVILLAQEQGRLLVESIINKLEALHPIQLSIINFIGALGATVISIPSPFRVHKRTDDLAIPPYTHLCYH